MSELSPEPFSRCAEVDDILSADNSLLGRVYRYDLEGLTAQEMAEREDTATANFVSKYRRFIHGLRTGEIPTSPTISKELASRVRTWLKRNDLSPDLRKSLEEYESLLNSRADDASAQSEEVENAVEKTKAAEAVGTPGIYVYTLPHYLRYPYDMETGRTLLKVGHSSVDALYRANSQGRLTALPEDPILLRIYPAEGSAEAERDFHGWLRDADHSASPTRRAGSEWYVTSTKFLDRIARARGMEVQVITEFEAGED